jgi:hypothetical protein
VVKAWGGEERLKNGDKTMASAIAGTTAGAVGGLIRKLDHICRHFIVTDTTTRRAQEHPSCHARVDSIWNWRTDSSKPYGSSQAQGPG